MNTYHPYTIFPLGDSALTIDFGNVIDAEINKKVLRLFHQLKNNADVTILDLIPAYSSLTIYYNVAAACKKAGDNETAFEIMAAMIEEETAKEQQATEIKSNFIEVPVCYSKKFALDIETLADQNKLSVSEVIKIHTSKTYRIYMLGFLPGFAYMGDVDERIAIARRQEPRLSVFAGAVGIAGKQTGIYPLESPGGWQIIGRTPLLIFRKENERPVLFQPGDKVKFYSITEDEFENYQTGNT